MSFMASLKNFFSPSHEEEIAVPPVAPATAPEAEELAPFEIVEPLREAATCQIKFETTISPPGTSLFETPQEAGDWPVVGAALSVAGVHSVITKGDVLIVARHESSEWSTLLVGVDAALRAVLGGGAAASAVQVPERSAPVSGDEADLRTRIERVIEAEINPAVASHGGFIELLDVQDSRVFIHMGGGCQGCAMSTATLKQGVETTLRGAIPEITEVLDTTDHAAGSNPYFQQAQH
jgi:Fe-S cluster biogenesis protein NfuA